MPDIVGTFTINGVAISSGGNTILSGTVAPGSEIGTDGDFYIDTVAFLFYGPKTAGAWGTGVTTRGPQGDTGTAGPAGPLGPAGEKGDTGPGIAPGGTVGQFLRKITLGDYETGWDTVTPDEVGAAPAYTATNIIYVAKWGSDANTGRAIGSPKLTIAAALTAAAALTPTSTNRITVMIVDSGTYTESLTIPAYVNLHGPSASIFGALTLGDDSTVTLDRLVATGDNQILLNKATGTSTSYNYINVIDGRGDTGTRTGVFCATVSSGTGIMFITTAKMFVGVDGRGVGDSSTGVGHMHCEVEDLYLAGNNAIGISGAGADASIIVRAGHILETGTPTSTQAIRISGPGSVYVTTNQIIADAAYTITGPGNLYLIAGAITGTTSVGGGTANVTVAGVGGSGAPTDAKYVTAAASSGLSAELVIPGLAADADRAGIGGAVFSDEFDDSASSWTWTSAPPVYDSNVTFPSHYYARESRSDQFAALSRAFAPAGDYDIRAKLSVGFELETANSIVFFVISNEAGTTQIQYRIARQSNTLIALTVFTVNGASYVARGTLSGVPTELYVRIKRVGTLFSCYWSSNGITWSSICKDVSFNFTVAKVMLQMNTSNGTYPVEFACDWVRAS
jgi:hypothetical protein